MRGKQDIESKIELENVDDELSAKYAEKMYKKINKVLKGADNSEEEGFHTGHLWKLKKELAPSYNETTTVKKNKEGVLLTKREYIVSILGWEEGYTAKYVPEPKFFFSFWVQQFMFFIKMDQHSS